MTTTSAPQHILNLLAADLSTHGLAAAIERRAKCT